MCIIAAKVKGLELPNEARINSMWEANSDGAGLMVYSKQNGLEIFKGYMTLMSFKDALYRIDRMLNLKDCDVVMHFRRGTHGGISKGLTHPFTVTDDLCDMKELYNKAEIAVAHNGVYPYKTDRGVSDSMMYIKEKIYPLYEADRKFYLKLNRELKYCLDGKLCFLTPEGIFTVGQFYKDEEDGIIYSNRSYTYNDDSYYDSWWKEVKEKLESMDINEKGFYVDSFGNEYLEGGLRVG